MNNLKELLRKNNLRVKKYQEKNKVKIVDTNKGKYVIKKNNKRNENLYRYLVNRNFNYILKMDTIEDYILYPYIEEVEMINEEKAIDLVNILALLHNKTTFYREISLDKVKEKYEDIIKKIEYLEKYYYDLQDIIEKKVYMSPGEYLLIRNISLIYSSLNFSKQNIDKWYDLKIKQKKERIVLLHKKPRLEHFLVNNNRYLINWDYYDRDIAIYDFLEFYKSDYLKVEMSSLYEIYQSKFTYTEDECLLFMSLISLPEKIVFTKNNYEDTIVISNLIEYIIKTKEFILKEYKEYKKENKDEFNK